MKRWFQTGSRPRVYLETLLLCAGLTFLTFVLYGETTPTLFVLALIVFINPCCSLYYALRLRPAKGGWIRQIASEVGALALLALLINTLMTSLVLRLLMYAYGPGNVNPPIFFDLVYLVIIAFPLVFFRFFSRLGVWWYGLCERHLLWSLVHSHLVALGLLQALILLPMMVLFAFAIDRSSLAPALPDNPVSLLAFRILVALPLLGLAILAATAVLAALLPASAVVSYFFARRVKRRLDALMDGAYAARDGNYRVRVPVTGQDEIAKLQTDFNAMVANLEVTVHALTTERETVQALLKSRRDLMASVSHELHTPIATIRAYLESAQRQQTGEMGKDYLLLADNDLEIVQREIFRLQTLIDDLFSLSRAEVTQLSLKCNPVQVTPLIKRVMSAVAPLAWRVQRVEVIAEAPSWLPLMQVDETRLEQTLRNLIDNSLRHTPPGGLIVISACAEGEFGVIQVHDTGEGISPELLPHVWERYSHDEKNGGSGIGLALVKSFVEAMGGQVMAESRPGEGASFTLKLPLAGTASRNQPLPMPRPIPYTVEHCDKAATDPR